MFALSDQQRAISDTATRLGAEHLTPFALQWEQDRHLPVEVLREAGRLKMGGLHVGPEVGGQALSRVDAALVVEGVATGCPAIAGCLSNHNTAAWMIDTYARPRSAEQARPLRRCSDRLDHRRRAPHRRHRRS
jgi:alkylation response protein AidB-like acyl-CoA dehydrogenase